MPENNGHHCPDHEEYNKTLSRVATNTDWIISAFKMGASIMGAIFVVVIVPVSVWMVNLDKRITSLETQLTYIAKK